MDNSKAFSRRFSCIIVTAVFSLFFIGSKTEAAEYSYKIKASPLLQRFIVKPSFDSFETELSVQNEGDPVYVYIQLPEKGDILTTVGQVEPELPDARYSTSLSFLLLTGETRRLRMNIRRDKPSLELRDYILDIPLRIQAPYTPATDSVSASILPVIHSKIVVSVSANGILPLDPKIALFRNKSGYFILNSEPANLVLTLQNRGEYLFPVSGFITVTDPSGKQTQVPIARTYVAASSQKNLFTDSAETKNVLFSIAPKDLKGGLYSVSSTLQFSEDMSHNVYGHTNFFVVPMLYIFIIALLLLSLLGVIFFISLKHV